MTLWKVALKFASTLVRRPPLSTAIVAKRKAVPARPTRLPGRNGYSSSTVAASTERKIRRFVWALSTRLVLGLRVNRLRKLK